MDKDCCTCEWDEICGWKFRDERVYCDKWKLEGERGNEQEQSE